MDARFVINDGQHRRAAIEQALKVAPSLAHETIAVVLFVDAGLKRSQQMFADLNKYSVRPTRSLSVLYDHNDPVAEMVTRLIGKVPLFKDRIEKEKTSISYRSTNLLTLSSVYQATKALLGKKRFERVSPEEERIALEFWNELPKHIGEWKMYLEGKTTSADLRRNYVHSHGVFLHAIGIVGNSLILEYPTNWKERLRKLEEVDWAKSNRAWEGRALMGGRLSKANINVVLATNYIKTILELPLSKQENKIEQAHLKIRVPEVAGK
jgi:DNA sulfur modification protein DndB